MSSKKKNKISKLDQPATVGQFEKQLTGLVIAIMGLNKENTDLICTYHTNLVQLVENFPDYSDTFNLIISDAFRRLNSLNM
jgi:hypothetical protein